jgi:DNA primase
VWFGYLKKLNITPKSTPEEKTVLKKELTKHINEINDSDLKHFFQRDFNDKFYNYFNTFTKQTKNNSIKNTGNSNFSPILTSEIVQTLKKLKKNHLPAKILLATLKNNPTLVTRVYETMVNIEGLPDDLAMFRDYLCEQTFDSAETLTVDAIKKGFSETLYSLDALDLKAIAPFAVIGTESEVALQGWIDTWNQHYLKLRVQNETNMMKARLKSSLNEKSWEQWQQIKTVLNTDNKN